MPEPSSITRTREIPPRRVMISILRAPASMLFSMSSFTTEAGRSTTSPAATWLATMSGSKRMRLISLLILDFGLRIASNCRAGASPADVYDVASGALALIGKEIWDVVRAHETQHLERTLMRMEIEL